MPTADAIDACTSDEFLMGLAQRNDAAAFAELHRRHAPAVRGLTRRICGTSSLAEDAQQEAFLAVWRYRDRYRPDLGSVRGWMLSIAHNRTIDLLRKDRRHQRSPGDDADLLERQASDGLTDVQAMAREDGLTIRRGLRQLPAEQARSIALAYYGGLTHLEIGRLGNVPLGTVKGRIRLGLDKLRADLQLESQAA